MLNLYAAIHDNLKPGFFRFAACFIIVNAELRPNCFGIHRDGILHHAIQVFGATEDVYDVDRFWYFCQAGIRLVAINVFDSGVHWIDRVPCIA